jgi:hypothetical protein
MTNAFAANRRLDRKADLSLVQRSGDPKAAVESLVVGRIPKADGRTNILGPEVPGAPARNPIHAILTCRRGAVRGGLIVAAAITILHPLPHIASHVVQPERISRKRSNG